MAENGSSGFVGKIVAGVFTAVVAPVLVIYVNHRLNPDLATTPPKGDKPLHIAAGPDTKIIVITAEGRGRTPDQAVEEALHHSVLKAIASLVDADTMTKQAKVIGDMIQKEGVSMVKSHKEESVAKQIDAGKPVMVAKVTANIPRKELVQKLREAKIKVDKPE